MDASFLIYIWLRTKPCPWLHENLSGFVICVCWVLVLIFIMFLVIDMFLLENFMFWFYLFWYVFGLIVCFALVSGQNMVFDSVHGWISVLESTQFVLFCFESGTKVLFGWLLFCWGMFFLRGCLANTPLDLFWQFCFE
jgi:hypothetical protein